MKLCTNSSIQVCQARLFRGDGAFGFAVGVGLGSVAVAVGLAATGVGLAALAVADGDNCAMAVGDVAMGVGKLGGATVFFGESVQIPNASAATATRAHEITKAGRVAIDFFSGDAEDEITGVSTGRDAVAGTAAAGSSAVAASNSFIA